MTEIVMPRLSDTMEEGTILSWLAADGEQVSRGQELVEIETDKANMTYESDQEGVLQIVAAEGDTLPVGAVIAHIGGGDNAGTPTSTTAKNEDEPALKRTDVRTVGEGPGSEISPGGIISPEGSAGDRSVDERVKASPLARRIASERGVDLRTMTGSGPGGRIVKADVQGSGRPEGHAPAAESVELSTAKGETTIVELTRTQQTIARRMAESKATIPEFALQAEIDMEACVALRFELKSLQGPRLMRPHTTTCASRRAR